MPNLPLVLAYLFWESGVAAVCLAAVVRFRPLAMRLPLFLSLNILVSGLSAAALSHARSNSPAAYMVLAAVYLASGTALAWNRWRPALKQLARLLQPSLAAFIIWFVLGCLLAFSIRPIEEVDSLYNLHYVVGWINNAITPYTFAYNYVPMWDLTSVPALVLTRSDYFFWLQSLKPVVLLGVVLWLIARELRMPHALSVWTIAGLLTFPYLWFGPTGVATNKNDMLHAAGYALLALTSVRWVREKFGRADVLATALGTAFISVKASGPVMLLASCMILCVVARKDIQRNFGRVFRMLAVVAVVWFAAAGQYYWHNYLVNGSPVYPYQINFGPIHLPGRGDMTATSILYSLGDPEVWRLFFLPAGGLSPDGLFFPLILATLLLSSPVVAGLALVRRRFGVAEVLAVYQLLTWGIYFRTIYSASASPGDLVLLRNGLNSTRYIEGPLLVGALCLVGALYRMGTPRVVIYLLLAAQAGSCFYLMRAHTPDPPWTTLATCGLGLALCSLCLRRGVLLPAGIAIVTLSLLVGANLVERRRPQWLQSLQPLYQPLYDAPPANLFYIIDDEFSMQLCWQWPFLGRRLQHGSNSGSREELAARTIKPEYVAWVQATPDATPPVLPEYEALAATRQGILLRRR